MKIVHLGKYYPPEFGGIESVTQLLATRHAAAGHEVTVACFTRHQAETSLVDHVRVHRFKAWRIVASQPLGWRYFLDGLRLARQGDVVHVQAPNLLAALMVLLLPSRVRVVVHWQSDIIGKGWMARIVRPLERAFLARADAVIATTPPYLEGSELLTAAKAKTRVIPIGIDAPAADDVPPLEAPVLAFLRGRPLVLAVGRLVPYKGFQHLIGAAAQLRQDAAVVIAGDGPLKGALQAAIEAAGLQDRVLLAGRVSDRALASLFGHARVFCLPSVERSEAFGVVLLEAMSRGIPSVATTIPGSGTWWVNEHDVSGLNVPPGQPQELARAIDVLLSDAAVHARLSDGARRRFASEFMAQTFCDRVMDLYLDSGAPQAQPTADRSALPAGNMTDRSSQASQTPGIPSHPVDPLP